MAEMFRFGAFFNNELGKNGIDYTCQLGPELMTKGMQV